jgi:hypothetical protein
MRKTNDPETIHKLYANKYTNWIMPFLAEHGLEKIPQLIICNTLYKLPDYYALNEGSFFLFDYHFYEFIYDLNYLLLDSADDEYLVDFYLKAYFENLCLNGRIDRCYCFA